MAQDPGGPARGTTGGTSGLRGRALWIVIGAVVVAAILGGVAGGAIVRWAWPPDSNGSSAAVASSSGSKVAACPAASVADQALPSVVTISANNGQQGGTGSGVVLRPGGYILTNNHVISVAAGGGTVTLLRSDGETTPATIVGRDPLTDLAVVKSETASGLPTITLGKSESLKVGQPVVALGSPLGLTSTVTTGIVSALNRYVQVPAENGSSAHLVGAIQTDASINPGNSGGALVDCNGQLVGINTAGAAVSNAGGGGSIGLGFAIPIDFARGIADELISSGRVMRPGLGLQVQPISSELAQSTGGTAGLFVQSVTAGGPADNAGLRPGDIITEVEGEPVRGIDSLVVKTLSMKAGDTIQLKYERQGASHAATLTLGQGG